MAEHDIPILVVDDAKFSSAIIAKVLREGGYTNVRFTNNPLQALRSLEKRAAQVVIADWLMPALDGVELTRRVKALDKETDHYTFVMLLTARDDAHEIQQAFSQGVDDFLNKSNIRDHLLARVHAAQRVSSRQNALLHDNKILRKTIAELQTTDLVDPVTGLGNKKFAIQRIDDLIRQAESRGGAACLLMVGINNLDVVKEQYEQSVIDELMSGISAKIRGLVRPLDVVSRPTDEAFTVITHQPSLENCTSHSFRRVFDNLYMHSFKTSEGYIPVVVGVSICAADESTGYPNAAVFMELGLAGLKRSFDTGIINVELFDPLLVTKTQTA